VTRRTLLRVGVASLSVPAGALAAARAGWFQLPARVVRIGIMGSSPDNLALSQQLRGFRDGLREAGWLERQNLVIDYRWIGDRPERYPTAAAELVALQPGVMAAASASADRGG
jgi:putative ABC transport system substrate-binding protein